MPTTHYADYSAVSGAIVPLVDDTHDLGTTSVAWQDGYFDGSVYADTVAEHTAAAGVTIDGVKLKDSIPYCDSIAEKTGAAGVTVDGVKLKDNNMELATGKVSRTITGETLGVGVATFTVVGEAMEITGDGGANAVTTITGGVTGQILILTFVDGFVTMTNDDGHGANTLDLAGNLVSADDSMLTLFFDGTSWYELARSVN